MPGYLYLLHVVVSIELSRGPPGRPPQPPLEYRLWAGLHQYSPNESVGEPKNPNFQRRNSLIPMTTILEESAKFDFSYRLNVRIS